MKLSELIEELNAVKSWCEEHNYEDPDIELYYSVVKKGERMRFGIDYTRPGNILVADFG